MNERTELNDHDVGTLLDSRVSATSDSAYSLGCSAEGLGNSADGLGSSAERLGSSAEGFGSSAEGLGSSAEGLGSSAEGLGSSAESFGSSAEGLGSSAEGLGSSAEGLGSFAAQDHIYTAVIEKRSGYQMWEIEVQEIDAAEWTNVGRFSGKSQDITYVPAPGARRPVQIRIRVRLWKGAAHVGLWSDAVTITVNP